jgi:hypothetical protein
VLQECRTAGRIGAIHDQLGGYHIYLWRNPWDQWWSYKVTPYFEVANQLIINAPYSPPEVLALRAALGFEAYAGTDLGEAFAHFSEKPRTSEENYLIFYLLWCLGLQAGAKHAHLMLNIDRLSDSPIYRDEMKTKLAKSGIDGINFADCQVPQARYLEQDQEFFTPLEDQVHHWLREGGWSQEELNRVQGLRQQYQPESWGKSISALSLQDMAEQASRARTLTRRIETNGAEILRVGAEKITQADLRATQSEARATQAETTAQQAEDKAQQAEAKAQQIEVRAQQTDVRAKQAEAAYNTVINSRSWRITEPLRLIFNGLRRLRNGGKHALKSVLKKIVWRAIRFISDRPRLKRLALAWVRKHPRLEQRLRRFAAVGGGMHSGKEPNPPMKLANLTPHARRIYADLKTAIERRQRENG